MITNQKRCSLAQMSRSPTWCKVLMSKSLTRRKRRSTGLSKWCLMSRISCHFMIKSCHRLKLNRRLSLSLMLSSFTALPTIHTCRNRTTIRVRCLVTNIIPCQCKICLVESRSMTSRSLSKSLTSKIVVRASLIHCTTSKSLNWRNY